MRIISGRAKGRILASPPGDTTRPTSDKIRGSVFNILFSRVEGASVLDLFGGTGALALEAVSRGAKRAVIVDCDRRALEAIRRNADNVGGDIEVIKGDSLKIAPRLTGRFDIVFLDPPYALTGAYSSVIEALISCGRLNPGALIICERARSRQIAYPDGVSKYDTREYGDTAVDFLRYGD